jgi:hypothetical protein
MAWMSYGGANPPVIICDRWQGEHGVENFIADMGERPEGTTLGRFGDVGDYEPGNVSWQTWKEQGTAKRLKNQIKFLAAIDVQTKKEKHNEHYQSKCNR